MDTPHDKPDLSEIFDLKRHKAVTGYVNRFEELFKERQAITTDIKELTDEVKEAEFTPVEVAAMKDIAKWKVGDKVLPAAVKLAALRRVANALKLDLFSWADEQRDDKAA
jgi:uncharacterized protein (UPF0335 family)